MALKRLITKTEYDALVPVLKEHYVKSSSGDDYVLDDDNTEYKGKLDEFRSNNRALMQEKTRLAEEMKRFEGIDPSKYQAALKDLEKLNRMEEADLLKEGKLDDVVKKRTQTMMEETARQIQAKDAALREAEQKATTYAQELGVLKIDTEVSRAVEKVGKVRPGAMDDIQYRARATWSINDKGQAIAKKRNGEVWYNAKGEHLTFDDWARQLLLDAPHLFESGSGGGSGGGRRGDSSSSGMIVVDRNDPRAFSANIENIAKGKAIVT